jgi:hypothetical protein
MAAARVLVIILVISPLPSSHVEPFKKIVHLIQSNAQGEKDAGDGEYYIMLFENGNTTATSSQPLLFV